MDALTVLAINLLPIAGIGVGMAARPLLGQLGDDHARRSRIRTLRTELAGAVEAHAQRVPPRRRHNHHCPACGRFARVTSASERGVWTRCRAHGIRLRSAPRRIGAHEVAELIVLVPHTPLGAEPPPVTSPLAIMPPWRPVDWLDDISPLAPSHAHRAA